MKFRTALCLFALTALILVPTPALDASSASASFMEPAPAAMCSAAPYFDELPPFLADGCTQKGCNLTCQARGYDFGVCLGSFCFCRSWL